MKRSALALLAALGLAAAAGAGPLDTHVAGGPWTGQIENARHEIALAVLLRELALTGPQAARLLAVLERLDRTIAAMVTGSEAPTRGWRGALAGLRDRTLALPTGVPTATREDLAAQRAWNENLGELEREVTPLRDEIAALLTLAQQKALRGFSPERALVGLATDDEELDEWTTRLAGFRAAKEAELEDTVHEQIEEILEESGHRERLKRAKAFVAEIRALPQARFDAELVELAKKLRALLSVAPKMDPPPPPESTDLPGAVDTHLLDMRMLPVLRAYVARGPKAAPKTAGNAK